MPILDWPVYADHAVADRCRSWRAPPTGPSGRDMPILDWPVYADRWHPPRSFFCFVAEREPAAVDQCADVLHIPTKKSPTPAPQYLESREIEAILDQPDRKCVEGQRDHVLLSFLYNTGARIQEALDVCPAAIRFEAPMCVRLFGKGRKERICPLWPETVALLKALRKRQPCADDEPLFVNRYGAPLGASGVRFKLAQYVQAAARAVPSLASKKVSPHTFRHAAAVHLVA